MTAARIIAVDVEERQLSMAQEVGAHEAVRSDADAAAAIRELVAPPPGGADVVLDCVSLDSTLRLGAAVVSAGGWLMLVGLGGGTLPLTVGLAPTIPLETRLVVAFWGTRTELVEVVALARAGLISAHLERFGLADAKAAYERLERGQLEGRAVVVPFA
jgi:alcohol dehydrogenase, propanol-preferring